MWRDGRALPIRLMASLLYLDHAYGESDESAASAVRCHAVRSLSVRAGEAGVEELLAKTIEAAVAIEAITPAEFAQLLVDTAVQEKAIAYRTDSRLLEVARARIARLAQRAGVDLKPNLPN